MLIVGVTGRTCSGKSFICQSLISKFADIAKVEWLDCDKLAHSLYLKGASLTDKIAANFGPDVIDQSTGAVDRQKLGAIVFDDQDALDRLSRLVWPELKSHLINLLEKLNRQNVDIALIDAAILLKAGFDDLCQIVLIVSVPFSVAADRAKMRGIPETKFQKMYNMNKVQSSHGSYHIGDADQAYEIISNSRVSQGN